jgi:hypothetical protein
MSLHFIYLFVGTLNVLPFINRFKAVHFSIAPICAYVLSHLQVARSDEVPLNPFLVPLKGQGSAV